MDHAKFRSPYSKRLSAILTAAKPLVAAEAGQDRFVRVESMARALHAAVRNNATETTALLLEELGTELVALSSHVASNAPLPERLAGAAAADARKAWRQLDGMVRRNYPGDEA